MTFCYHQALKDYAMYDLLLPPGLKGLSDKLIFLFDLHSSH